MTTRSTRFASRAVRRTAGAIWPMAALATAAFAPAALSYARAPHLPDAETPRQPATGPGWSDRAAGTMTALMIGGHSSDGTVIKVSKAGLAYSGE